MGCFGRIICVVLELMLPGKAEEVTWRIPCVRVREMGR